MGEDVTAQCPWCGESLELWIEPDAVGTSVQDCDVCCRPCVVEVHWDEDAGASATVRRE